MISEWYLNDILDYLYRSVVLNSILNYHWQYHWVIQKYHWLVQWYWVILNGIQWYSVVYHSPCPIRRVLLLYQIPPPTYGTHNTDHMPRMYSPITILDPTTKIRNTQHWPHALYVQSYHYIRSHHQDTEHTTLTTCPVCTVLSLY